MITLCTQGDSKTHVNGDQTSENLEKLKILIKRKWTIFDKSYCSQPSWMSVILPEITEMVSTILLLETLKKN